MPELGRLSDYGGGLSTDIHIRYDYQTESNWIFGAELDLSMPGGNSPGTMSVTRMDAAGVSVDPDLFSASRGFETETNALASARLRLGYAMGDYMVYGTGGVAYADFDATIVSAGTVVGQTLSATQWDSESAVGGVVGGGIATFVADNASVSLEGLYYRFDKEIDFEEDGEKMSVTLDDAFSVMMKFSIRLD